MRQKMMENNKPNLTAHAMQAGTAMGLFWIAKFALFPAGLAHPFLFFFFLGLTLCVPFVGWHLTRNYRDRVCGGVLPPARAWSFAFLMYIYAALLTAMGHYIYFRFLDHGFIVNTYEQMLDDFFAQAPHVVASTYQKPMEEAIAAIRALTPIQIAIQQLTQNVFCGAILALITLPFVARRNGHGAQTPPNE